MGGLLGEKRQCRKWYWMETKEQRKLIKVVVLGPESTGKSFLCQALSEYYSCAWVPEFARAYLKENGKNYTYEDLLEIAKGQHQLEQEHVEEWLKKVDSTKKDSSVPLLIIDTDQHVMRVWSEYVFGKCHLWILDQIQQQNVDLYLLCKPDIPWVKDELREYPDYAQREELFHYYFEIMQNQPAPFRLIEGDYNNRIKTAIGFISPLLSV
jgi:NadR type nicotinamide-nucleotide adenylyltransferase